MSKQLIVFDFDWSFVDQDTDRWVFEYLSTPLRRRLQDRKTTGGSQCVPDVVHETMQDLYAAGYTKAQVLEALRALPFHPAMKRAVLGLQSSSPSTSFLCLSNSNSIYISTILQHHNLTSLFSDIITNPASWSETEPDRISIGRRRPASLPPHGCDVGCLVNMCKGAELDEYVEQRGEGEGKAAYKRIVYIGDGGNDFCPLLRLRQGDLALVRKGFELQGRVEKEGKARGLKCDVKYWTQAWEIEEYFQALV